MSQISSRHHQKGDLTFCRRFGYPDEVRDHFRDILGLTLDALGESNVLSVLLLGSTARGELSYRRRGGTLDLFSDYELVAVVLRDGSRHSAELQRRLTRWEAGLPFRNPLFHVDMSVKSRWRMRLQAPIIWTYETRANGITIFGEDARRWLPRVTLARLDYANLAQLLMCRLWMMLMHVPRRFLLGSPSARERALLKYVVCRNVLDLPTILLPYEGVLLPSYGARKAYLEKHYPETNLARFLGPGFPAFHASCYAGKMQVAIDHIDLHTLYRDALQYFARAALYLAWFPSVCETHLRARTSAGDGTLPDTVSQVLSHRHFPSRHALGSKLFKKYLHQVSLARHDLGLRAPLRALGWLRRAKVEPMVCALLHLHQAFSHFLAGDAGATGHIESAGRHLKPTLPAGLPDDLPLEPRERWLHMRREVVRFMVFWYYGHNPDRLRHYLEVLESVSE